MSRRKERWKEKQRQQVKEKMDKSVRAAQIYDELTRQNEARINGTHRHGSSSHSSASSQETITKRLKSCVVYPVVFALIILVITVFFIGIVSLTRIGWVKDNISFRKPHFAEYQQAEVLPIEYDGTNDTVSKSDVAVPGYNENYAAIQCDKLGENPISVFYKGNYDALRIGASQENEDNLLGFSGRNVIYAYHTTYFKNLSSVAEGDKITVTTSYGQFVYKVYKIGTETRRYSFDEEDENVIVLYTDEYSGITGNSSDKFIYVYASLISGTATVQ